MKCHRCGGALSDLMTPCAHCSGSRNTGPQPIHYRNLGTIGNLACPSCESTLSVIEFDSAPPLRIERCFSCHGMFFNPGELQAMLDARTSPHVRFDPVSFQHVADAYGQIDEVFYRKCPMCQERMSQIHFGGCSGIILDRCGTHGLWVEGGELSQLTGWWRSGGNVIFRQSEADKANNLLHHRPPPRRRTLASTSEPQGPSWTAEASTVPDWLDALAGLASFIID